MSVRIAWGIVRFCVNVDRNKVFSTRVPPWQDRLLSDEKTIGVRTRRILSTWKRDSAMGERCRSNRNMVSRNQIFLHLPFTFLWDNKSYVSVGIFVKIILLFFICSFLNFKKLIINLNVITALTSKTSASVSISYWPRKRVFLIKRKCKVNSVTACCYTLWKTTLFSWLCSYSCF